MIAVVIGANYSRGLWACAVPDINAPFTSDLGFSLFFLLPLVQKYRIKAVETENRETLHYGFGAHS